MRPQALQVRVSIQVSVKKTVWKRTQQRVTKMCIRDRCHSDRFFQTNALDVANDVIEDSAIAVTRVEDLDFVDRDHLQIAGWMFFAHAALLIRVRSAIP